MEAGTQLLFVNFTNPSRDAQQVGFRRQIRSHVTKKQHQGRNASGVPGDKIKHTPRKRTKSGALVKTIQVSVQIAVCDESSSSTTLDVSTPRSFAAPNKRKRSAASQKTLQRRARAVGPRAKRKFKEIASKDAVCSHGTPAPPMGACRDALSLEWFLEDPTDQLNIYCNRLGASMSNILSQFQSLVDDIGPDLEQRMKIAPGSTNKYLVPMVLGDQALLASTTLWCVSMIRHLKGQAHRSITLMELRGYAIACAQAAIEDPALCSEDALLATVSTLANYEVVYGSREIYRIHMKGLVNIISLRGGLQNLGCEGFTKAMLLYHDANASTLARSAPCLRVFRPATPEVDPRIYLCGVSPEAERCKDELVLVKEEEREDVH